ncbi:hypothetical protein MNEG_10142 [Monoraphidium neglectum]|uniref:Protein kinase domain-containing protein n=1 Tax=Monoraphidium neglectum TaxID=145388 RepID=A0A0D2MTQ3_9CHLO|nr:hypothetical protein MNEG_10142 [Monoraphidium neglectum]KIY97820.1 hypothetical protein MNEG_10142 [Monoraphidium neglectum]|eukprot:XP_013896840.1 hypothetical protein MNEG_10142 [Monoraphidium neglectum]
MLPPTTQLADFGLSKILKESERMVNHSGAGTVTHLAPEMFKAGSQLTTAVDVYAFGVLMWEPLAFHPSPRDTPRPCCQPPKIYTGSRPFHGLTREVVIDAVLNHGARPTFPPGTPRPYAALAQRCWAAAPRDRPAFEEIVAALQQAAAGLQADAAAAAAAQAQAQVLAHAQAAMAAARARAAPALGRGAAAAPAAQLAGYATHASAAQARRDAARPRAAGTGLGSSAGAADVAGPAARA